MPPISKSPHQSAIRLWLAALLIALLTSCVREQSPVIVITATFQPPHAATTAEIAETLPSPMAGGETAHLTTPPGLSSPRRHIVQPGDTLSAIAAAEGISTTMLAEANNLTDPNRLEVGQVLIVPEFTAAAAPDFRILPDNRLVRGPGSASFNVETFIASQPGFIRIASDTVNERVLTAAQVVQRVSNEFSVDARLLLALLELRARWLSDPQPDQYRQVYPLGAQASPFGFDRNGLYRQLAWAADRLNYGYYQRKYGRLNTVEFTNEARILRFADNANPATVGLQYMLSLFSTYGTWQREIGVDGLFATYARLFGNPFAEAIESLTPPNLTQPAFILPFPAGQEWFFTGGPHGGWGAGSAWAAIDFAPPDDPTTVSSACYVSQYFATAVAPGVIARTDDGVVVLDLDGDGDEATGWSVLYLHIAEQDRVTTGTIVRAGDPIGRPSCDGGVSTGTHIHVARRYNGEWIPADCSTCPAARAVPNLAFGEWTVYGYTGQEYQGYMTNGREQRVADQGRTNPLNRVSW